MEARIHGGLVAGFAGGRDTEGVIQEAEGATGRLFPVALLQGIRQFQQGVQPGGAGDDQVTQMRGKGRHEMQGVESLGKHLVEKGERRPVIPGEEMVHQGEAVFVVQDIEVPDHILIFDIRAAEGDGLVENGEGVAHGAIGLGGDDVEGFVVDPDPFLFRDAAEVPDHVGNADAVEIVGLAAGEDGREDLVLFGRRQDEDSVRRGLLQRLEESVERGLGKHVDLVDDIDAVLAHLRRDLHFLHQGLDVVHGVVGRGVQFMDAVRPAFLEGDAGLALPARFHVGPRMRTVDHLGEDARRRGLPHPARTAEEVGVGKLPPLDGVGKGPGDGVLAEQGLEGVGPVFACRYDILTHSLQR